MYWHYLLNYVLGGGGLGTIGFALYVTFHPGMKGVTFRPDDTGEEHFRPSNIVALAASPLHDSNFWKVKLWDINYLIWLFAGTGLGFGMYILRTVTRG